MDSSEACCNRLLCSIRFLFVNFLDFNRFLGGPLLSSSLDEPSVLSDFESESSRELDDSVGFDAPDDVSERDNVDVSVTDAGLHGREDGREVRKGAPRSDICIEVPPRLFGEEIPVRLRFFLSHSLLATFPCSATSTSSSFDS